MNATDVSSANAGIEETIVEVVKKSREASRAIACAPTSQKNQALSLMAQMLRSQNQQILKANAEDVAAAKASGLSKALVDRLSLTPQRLEEMVRSIEAVIELSDPVGELIRSWRRPNGLEIRKLRVPLGVVAIIYESRPNVTSDCASLCLKSGNAVVLRGGSESFRSNQAIGSVLKEALRAAKLPEATVSLIPTADRRGVDIMLQLDAYIDVVIPRAGEDLIRKITSSSRIPVIKHAKGICHVYVDADADLEMAKRIVHNAKCQRPATCNAMETLLVHKKIAQRFLPEMIRQLRDSGVEIRGCPQTQAMAGGIIEATEQDWQTEYLDLIVSVKIVESLQEAIAHIGRYGSAHSDAIVTQNEQTANRFLKEVDSAAVYVNASTRFTDGFQFGLGAEIGISTDRLHARGPMGLEELTTYKYVVIGSGQLRE